MPDLATDPEPDPAPDPEHEPQPALAHEAARAPGDGPRPHPPHEPAPLDPLRLPTPVYASEEIPKPGPLPVMVAGRPLNATAASLLGFLHEGPMTGWDLVVTAQQRIGAFWSLTQSQVYRELTAMSRLGLVEAGERGRRDRQPYTITPAGRDVFAAWAAREPSHETIRFPLLLTVVLGRHIPPDRLARYVANHRRVHAARLAAYERQLAATRTGSTESEPYTTATLHFGLAYERAVLAWFDSLPASISRCARGS